RFVSYEQGADQILQHYLRIKWDLFTQGWPDPLGRSTAFGIKETISGLYHPTIKKARYLASPPSMATLKETAIQRVNSERMALIHCTATHRMWGGLELENSPWKPYPRNRFQEMQIKQGVYRQHRRMGKDLPPPGLVPTYGGFQPLPGANIQPRAIQKTAGEVSENPGQRLPRRAEGPPQDEKTKVPPPQISTLRCPAGQVFTPKIKAIRSVSAPSCHRQRRLSSFHEGNSPPHSAQESGIGSLEELSLGAELELLGYP
ncbi:MAG: hypothetical protein GY696_17765, partial [Gammaproteobacteria bacterium]|nr:hypothetical protein [Gammaproteobacteria bacterium]